MCYIPKSENSPPRPIFYKGDYVAMKEELNNHNWDLSSDDSINTLWNTFADKLDKLINTCVPLSRTKDNYKKCWMTVETASVIDKKRRTWVKYINCKNDFNYSQYYIERIKATETIRHAKRDFEKKLSRDTKSNLKLFWKYVKPETK